MAVEELNPAAVDVEMTTTRDDTIEKHLPVAAEVAGVAEAEAQQVVWGQYGKYLVWFGLAMLMIAYEIDNTTLTVYSNYAPSEFNALSQKATLGTACVILFAVVKPIIAKFCDVWGRATSYTITISFFLLGYILMAASKNFATYAVGSIFYTIGQSGTNITTDIVISDISSSRWRSFALSIQFFPFLIMPWVAGQLCNAVLNGIGWRWGVGMMGFIMPGCAAILVTILFVYQRKAKKAELVVTKKTTVVEFFSSIDGGGLALLCIGFALFFLPISLASLTPGRWDTGWIIAVMVVGGVLLVALVPYEKWVAKHPILPPHYFKNLTIVISCLVMFLDQVCFSATHTYIYSWAVISHNYDTVKATYFLNVNGVVQALVGMLAGLIIYRTRRYKWLNFGAVCVRAIGYGVMIRLRGSHNTDAEIFLVQAIQGIGSGVLTPVCLSAAQVVRPHGEMAQISALVLLFAFLGSGIGGSVAGGIYTNYFVPALRKRMGEGADESTIMAVYNSITSTAVPAWGTPEREAANEAYSDVMRYISIAALAVSCTIIPLAFFMPNLRLRDDQNLVAHEEEGKRGDQQRN